MTFISGGPALGLASPHPYLQAARLAGTWGSPHFPEVARGCSSSVWTDRTQRLPAHPPSQRSHP